MRPGFAHRVRSICSLAEEKSCLLFLLIQLLNFLLSVEIPTVVGIEAPTVVGV